MQKIVVQGVPMDLGANLRGVDMGPSALRIAGLVPRLRKLGHAVDDCDIGGIPSRVTLPPDESRARYAGAIAAACERIMDSTAAIVADGAIPVSLGGDHSIAVGTVGGVARHYHARGEKIGLIWFDAHADMNIPETSPSGNVHGMPLSAIIGLGVERMTQVGGLCPKVAPANVVIVGARDIDEGEREVVRQSGVHVFTMSAIDHLGMSKVTERAIALASAGTAGIHLSFDLDGLDPSFAPGVGTPVRGGISFREAHLFMELISESARLVALDLVELNPVKDEHNQTAEVAVHLTESVFGRRIYTEIGDLE